MSLPYDGPASPPLSVKLKQFTEHIQLRIRIRGKNVVFKFNRHHKKLLGLIQPKFHTFKTT